MLEIIFTCIGISISYLCYKTEFHKIVKKSIITRVKRVRNLVNMVSSEYKSIYMIIWVSLCLIFKANWISFLQYINKSIIKKKGKNLYELTYVINGKMYKIIINRKRGPSNVLLITDNNDNDMTREIGRYLGPGESFHRYEITPDYFGKDLLVFEMADGRNVSFDRFDVIKLQ